MSENPDSGWSFPVNTGRKLNVHSAFRRRPGCLLNVLCTFNLRPVLRGKYFEIRQQCIYQKKLKQKFFEIWQNSQETCNFTKRRFYGKYFLANFAKKV